MSSALTLSDSCASLSREVDVPELDRFERTFQAGWRVAYRHAREGVASDGEIGDKLVKTLAKTLRERDGIPGLPAMIAIVTGTDRASLLELFGALDGIVRDFRGHRHSKIAAEVVKSFLVQQDVSTTVLAYDEAARMLSDDVCTALVEHYFFANARQHLVTEGKIASPERARHWQNQMEQLIRPAIQKIADQISRAPDARGLRAPKNAMKKQSTSSLLEEELLLSPVEVTA